MTYLPLPTDNLYKFLALAGLAVVILTVVSYWRLVYEIEDRKIDADLEASLVINEQERALAKAKIYENYVADYKDTTREDLINQLMQSHD